MPRKASSVSEIAQIVRVNDLLHRIGVCPSPRLEVIAANGGTQVGQLLRVLAGNGQDRKGWTSYGSIVLVTACGKIEIDYLDVVSVRRASATENDEPR